MESLSRTKTANKVGLRTEPDLAVPQVTHASCSVLTKISILTTTVGTFLFRSFRKRGTNSHLSNAFEQSSRVVMTGAQL